MVLTAFGLGTGLIVLDVRMATAAHADASAAVARAERDDVRHPSRQHIHLVDVGALIRLFGQPDATDQLLQLEQVSSACSVCPVKSLLATGRQHSLRRRVRARLAGCGSRSNAALTLSEEPLRQLVACHITALVRPVRRR